MPNDKVDPPTLLRQRRLEVAKDVLAHMDAVTVAERVWVRMYDVPQKLIEDSSGWVVLADIVDLLDAGVADNKCRVCAAGAALMSYVRLYKSDPKRELLRGLVIGTGMEASTEVAFESLGDLLGRDFVDLIECAFERGMGYISAYRIDSNRGKKVTVTADDVANRAITFGCQYASPKSRLHAIMENVVENGGDFVP